MRLIITGAAGFIGRNLLRGLPEGWEAVAIDRSPDDLSDLLHGAKARVRRVRADLLRPETFPDAFSRVGRDYDAAVYLAANGDPAFSVKDPHADLSANTCALINFLEQFRVKRFVFFSSGAVYDGLEGPVRPGIAVSPLLPYAVSKQASEQYLKFFASRRGTVGEYVILRFFGAFGPYEPERKIYTRLVRAFGIEGKRSFTVRGDGENLIDAMYVGDTVEAILRVLEGSPRNVTVDFCCGAPLTVNGLVREAARVFGVEEPEIAHEGTVPEQITFRASPHAMREMFGFTPHTALCEGLARLREFIRTRP